MPGPLALVVITLLQGEASVGLGIGTVRYAGGSSFSTTTLSPAAQFLSPSIFAGAGASFSSLPGGSWATQERVDFWLATPARRQLRAAVAGSGVATSRAHAGWTGAAHGVAEVLWVARGGNAGVAGGVGPSYGGIAGEPSVTALHLRARAWWHRGRWQLTTIVEPTRFLDAWFTDVSLAAGMERNRLAVSLSSITRLSGTYGSKGAASASLQWSAARGVTLEAAAGGYLADPYQGFPRSGFLTAGVRLFTRTRPRGAEGPGLGPLVPERRGNRVVVRFRMPGARTVAIAGDWNEWHPAPLVQTADGVWTGELPLAPGTYHFSLLVDGKEWVVPGGVAVVKDGFGGLVAVLTVL